MAQLHRVKRDRAIGTPLPKDSWQGRTFVEADGRELEVIWNGHRNGPELLKDWPSGSQPHERTIGRPMVTP